MISEVKPKSVIDENEVQKYAATFDRSLQVNIGRLSGGISPAALSLAFFDWYVHLIMHMTKQFELYQHLQHFPHDVLQNVLHSTQHKDKRFSAPAWQLLPYRFIYESFLLLQNNVALAATNVSGVNKHHLDVVNFTLRQILDMVSPSNSIFTNPEVQQTTIAQKGTNFLRGFQYYLDDVHRYQSDKPPAGAEQFVIGKNMAITPGKVIYRNRLIELIQYAPMTEKVYADPILITPAWIMKYYILDLSPKHSLVRYLVSKGHTVLMISWKNPQKKDADLGMDDYLNLGIFAALDVISAVLPQRKVHLVGYCLGGTLTAIATATMARDSDQRLATMTLLAAQTDFNDPGELGLFIDESQIAFLENIMKQKGYLDTHQMTGTFQLLRSNDLIWSRLVREYLLGERKPLTDLMAWNADTTRLPYKMHAEYLRNLFLNNQLAEGKYQVNGKPIALPDITLPMFVVATEHDHVSPWHSVFKINLFTTSDVTFILTSGGHNVGIVSLPSKKTKRRYRVDTFKESAHYIDADTWYQQTKPTLGSWWPVFESWLAEHGSKKIPAPQHLGSKKQGYPPLEDAPGTYVLMK